MHRLPVQLGRTGTGLYIYSRFSTGYSHGTIAQRYSLQSRHAAYGTACSMHCSTLSGMQHAACSVQHGVPSHTAGTMQCITPCAACGTCYIVQHAACGAYSVACSMQHIMQCDMQQAPRSTARSMLHRTQRTSYTTAGSTACGMQHAARSTQHRTQDAACSMMPHAVEYAACSVQDSMHHAGMRACGHAACGMQ